MNGVILFDVDQTLFDTPTFAHKAYKQSASHLGTSLEEIESYKEEYKLSLEKYTDFNPPAFLELLAQTYATNTEALTKLFYHHDLFTSSLFPETMQVLEYFHHLGPVGIFSEAREDWQLQKLSLSGILPYIDRQYLFIFSRKTQPEAIEQLPSCATVIDDVPDVVSALSTRSDLTRILIDRNQTQLQANTRVIHSLTELIDQ